MEVGTEDLRVDLFERGETRTRALLFQEEGRRVCFVVGVVFAFERECCRLHYNICSVEEGTVGNNVSDETTREDDEAT